MISLGREPQDVGQKKYSAAERRQMLLGMLFSVAPPGLFVFWLWFLGLTPQAKYLSPLRGFGRIRIQRCAGFLAASNLALLSSCAN